MTNNCPEEKEALSTVWHNSILTICAIHNFQQALGCLHDRKDVIDNFYRPKLLSMFKKLVYVQRVNEFEVEFEGI